MPGEVEHAAHWRTVLDVALGKWSAYDYDDVPDPLPNLYGLITLSQRAGETSRASGQRLQVGYRLTLLAVGRSIDEARWVRDQAHDALTDRGFIVAGRPTSLLRVETEVPIEPDEGRFSGFTAWTYNA